MLESLEGPKREEERNARKKAKKKKTRLFVKLNGTLVLEQRAGHVFISASVMPRSFLASLWTQTVVRPPSLSQTSAITSKEGRAGTPFLSFLPFLPPSVCLFVSLMKPLQQSRNTLITLFYILRTITIISIQQRDVTFSCADTTLQRKGLL